MKIGTKLSLGVAIGLLLMIAMAIYLFSMARDQLEDSVGSSAVLTAEQMLDRMNQYIYHKAELLQIHSQDEMLQETLKESNRQFDKFPDIEKYLSQEEQEWVETPPDSESEFVRDIMDNGLSRSLKREFIDFYDTKYGYPVFSELIVTNRYGAAVAATERISGYRNDTYTDWKSAQENGVSVSDIVYDESSETYGVTIAVRVDNQKGDFIGVIVGILSIKDVIAKAEITTKKYETMEIRLITDDGKLVYATRTFSFLEDVSGRSFYRDITAGRYGRNEGYFIAEENEKEKLFSYVRSGSYYSYKGINTILLVSYDTKEILQPINNLRKAMWLGSAVFILVGAVLIIMATRSIIRPISRLAGIVETVDTKSLVMEVDPGLLGRKDEVGGLTVAFSGMVTRLKNAQEKLVETEKLALLGQLAGGIAHELRNPLGGIKNAAYFLKMALDASEPEVRESIDIIGKEVEKSEGIINSILSYARPKQPVKHKMDVNDIIRQVLTRASIPDTITVSAELGALPDILADVDHLEQVFGNVILNAIQAMPDGGRLTIRTEAKRDGFVNIAVSDTGSGIPKEIIQKIFEPLYTTKARGVGLGLALTKTFVEAHGGTIEARSKAGKGSTFIVRLPIEGKEGK